MLQLPTASRRRDRRSRHLSHSQDYLHRGSIVRRFSLPSREDLLGGCQSADMPLGHPTILVADVEKSRVRLSRQRPLKASNDVTQGWVGYSAKLRQGTRSSSCAGEDVRGDH